MNKIPTIFERDWDGDRSRVLDIPASGCEWVFAGEGVATRKYDGQAALVGPDGKLYRRHEVKVDKKTGLLRERPDGFSEVEIDATTGNVVGWVPVGDGPEDRWFREAFVDTTAAYPGVFWKEGTYELVGPKVQGNPEGYDIHLLIKHEAATTYIVPRTFDGIRDLLTAFNMPGGNDGVGVEGFVFHHPDGRMAKIKARDFGIRRAVAGK